MNEKLEEILELPNNVKIGILGGTILVIVGLFWFISLSSLNDQISKLKKEISGDKGLQTEVAEQEGIARNLDKFKTEVARLDVELKKALEELPDSSEIHDLLEQISDKARDAGLEIRLFKPTPEQKRDVYAEVPVQIEVAGTYHQVATFFDEVGHLERVVNLDQLNISEPVLNDDRMNIKTQVTATAFRFLEESERPDVKKEEDSKRRRKGKTEAKAG